MSRTPPSSSGSVYRDPIPIMVFSKEGSAVYTRLIHRVPIRLTLRDGGSTVDAVRYGARYWPTYKSETFAEKSKQWVNDGDTIYGPDSEPITLPLEHRYLFECDSPLGTYGW